MNKTKYILTGWIDKWINKIEKGQFIKIFIGTSIILNLLMFVIFYVPMVLLGAVGLYFLEYIKVGNGIGSIFLIFILIILGGIYPLACDGLKSRSRRIVAVIYLGILSIVSGIFGGAMGNVWFGVDNLLFFYIAQAVTFMFGWRVIYEYSMKKNGSSENCDNIMECIILLTTVLGLLLETTSALVIPVGASCLWIGYKKIWICKTDSSIDI